LTERKDLANLKQPPAILTQEIKLPPAASTILIQATQILYYE